MKTSIKSDVSFKSLWPFLILAFGICWGIVSLYLFVSEPMQRIFGPLTGQHPLFYLATYAPALSALLLVGIHGGWRSCGGLLSRFGNLRASRGWWLYLLLGIPLTFYVASFFKGNLHEAGFPFESLWTYLAACFFMAIKGPVEEIGWRGMALPLLQRRMAPFWSGLILGVIWGVWHLPAFLLSDTPQSAWAMGPFFLGTIALSLIVTPLFNQSRGSILLPALFHFILINPLWPDAQPYDSPLFMLTAAAVTWMYRKQMFSRDAGYTEVIPS